MSEHKKRLDNLSPLKRALVAMEEMKGKIIRSEDTLSISEPEGSSFIGKTIREIDVRKSYKITIVAIKRPTGKTLYNPSPTTKLNSGDILICLGPLSEFHKLQADILNGKTKR